MSLFNFEEILMVILFANWVRRQFGMRLFLKPPPGPRLNFTLRVVSHNCHRPASLGLQSPARVSEYVEIGNH